MTTDVFAILALFLLGFGLISGYLENSIITPPMAFVSFGLLSGSLALNLVSFDLSREIIDLIPTVTLVLILFTDASRISLTTLKRQHDIPVRLLTVALPLVILFGTVVASVLFEDFNVWEAAVLATILAPTDAALGQAVISSPRVPVRISQALNVESGLNDGICLPFLLIFLSLADTQINTTSLTHWVEFILRQVIFGPIVGIAVGYVCGWLISVSTDKGWMNKNFEKLATLAISALAYSLAELVEGNGFIAVFCSGLALGNTANPPICSMLHEFGEVESQFLVLITFIIFGATIVPNSFPYLDWLMVVYALLSLTVIRIIAVVISMIGKGLRLDTLLFLGWFGPRGVASVIYVLLLVEREAIVNSDEIFATVVTTVLVSIFAHGITAFPASIWYAKQMEKAREIRSETPEHANVERMPVRLPYGGRRRS